MSICDDEAVKTNIRNGMLPTKPVGFEDKNAEWQLVEAMCCSDPGDRLSLDLAVRVLGILARRSRLAADVREVVHAHVNLHFKMISSVIHVPSKIL